MPEESIRTLITSTEIQQLFWYFLTGIIVWGILKWLKDKVTDYYDRKKITNGTILSENSYYKIGMPPRGFLRRIDKDRALFEEHFEDGHIDYHYVPLELMVKSTVTKSRPRIILSSKEQQLAGIKYIQHKETTDERIKETETTEV